MAVAEDAQMVPLSRMEKRLERGKWIASLAHKVELLNMAECFEVQDAVLNLFQLQLLYAWFSLKS